MTKNHTLPQNETAALITEDETTRTLNATGIYERFKATLPAGSAEPRSLYLVRRDEDDRVTPIKRLGASRDVPTIIAALARHRGEHGFTPEQEQIASDLASKGENCRGRRDLTGLPTFTIDGESTRDFDDAISARWEGRRIRVWIHVADVAAFVRPGSPLDLEARRRATSVYLPTLTVPMLPQALSTGVCSLVPGKARAAVTCEVLLQDGLVLETSFYRSRIRSIARLTYDHVDSIFEGASEPGPSYAAALDAARQAALDRTNEEDSQQRDSETVYMIEDGLAIGTTQRVSSESHRLIERLMVLANQEVAGYLLGRGVPSLYRVHQGTTPIKTQQALNRLRALGVNVPEDTLQSATEAVEALRERQGARYAAMKGILLSARAAASYSRDAAAHDGLELETYTHFTSPIRRYSDLVVHRALLAEIGAEHHEDTLPYAQLPSVAEHLTQRSIDAKRLERRARAICSVSLLRQQISREQIDRNRMLAVVTGMGPGGAYVQSGSVEGMIPASRLPGSPDESLSIWRGTDTRLAIGDTLHVRVIHIDDYQGRISFEPVAKAARRAVPRANGRQRSRFPERVHAPAADRPGLGSVRRQRQPAAART